MNFGVDKVCGYFEKSRQAYYQYIKRNTSLEDQQYLLRSMVMEHRKGNSKLGGKKLYFLLKEDIQRLNLNMGRDAFFTYLKDESLLVKPSKKYARTTQSFGWCNQYTDHYNGQKFTKPNQAWVSDITYVRVEQKFMYLSLITDAFSRKIIGWKLAPTLEIVWSIEALKMALKQAKVHKGIVHHSDRGFQYTSKAYTGILKEDHKMLISMGETGNCYDNALAERINGILKGEYLLDSTFKTENVAQEAIKAAIENYNNQRPHWALNLKTPNSVHQAA